MEKWRGREENQAKERCHRRRTGHLLNPLQAQKMPFRGCKETTWRWAPHQAAPGQRQAFATPNRSSKSKNHRDQPG